MKVSELPYARYTIEEARETFARFEAAMDAASDADAVVAARGIYLDALRIRYRSLACQLSVYAEHA